MPEGIFCFPGEGLMVPIFENIEVPTISPARLDSRLVTGWRHFGTKFFRYNFALQDGVLCGVLPLRLRLENFELSKSQRRIQRRNSDLEIQVIPAVHGPEYDEMFEQHRGRFTENVPDSLRDFLSDSPSEIPCLTVAIELRLEGKLLAVSFLDVGAESVSSVYGMFDPTHGERSLGIYTFLCEMEWAREQGKRFHYLGYSYTVPSIYDYKKGFAGVEAYDWGRAWVPLPPDFVWSRKLEATDDSAEFLRPAREEDWAEIDGIQRSCFPPSAIESIAALRSIAVIAPELCLVAGGSEGLRAYLLAHPWTPEDLPPLGEELTHLPAGSTSLFIHDLAVNPAARGSGLAHRMVHHLLARAASRGLTEASLLSVQGTTRFWSQFGFVARPDLTERHRARVEEFYALDFQFMTASLTGGEVVTSSVGPLS